MIFSLVQDFAAAIAATPEAHPRRRVVALLEEALRRDVHFIDRHPTTLFQCLWNTCWWYDCPDVGRYYAPPIKADELGRPFWDEGNARLCQVLEQWRGRKERDTPGFFWVRSLRPPAMHLGSPQVAVLRGHQNYVWDVAVAGGRIASSSTDGTVRLWDTNSGSELVKIPNISSSNVAFSPDGQFLVGGSSDGTVRVWRAESGAVVAELRGHTAAVNGIALSADGHLLVSGSDDATIRLWDMKTRTELAQFPAQTKVRDLAVSPDGRRVAAAVSSNSVGVWDVATRSPRAELPVGCIIGCMAFAPDGRYLAIGSADNTVVVWDSLDNVERCVLRGHQQQVDGVAFSPDGRRIASASGDTTVRVWDWENGREIAALYGHDGHVTSVAFGPDDRLASGSWDQTVRVWDLGRAGGPAVLRQHESRIEGVAFADDGQRLATSGGKTVRVWDVTSGSELAVVDDPESTVTAIAFSPDGRRIATGSYFGTVRVWDWAARRELSVLRGHALTTEVTEVEVPDLERPRVRAEKAWDGSDREIHDWGGVSQIKFHHARIYGLSFSPDGRVLATGSVDGTARQWDLATGTCTQVVQIPEGRRVRFDQRLWQADPTGPGLPGAQNDPRAEEGFGLLLEDAQYTTVFRYESNGTWVTDDGRTGNPVAWLPVQLDATAVHPCGVTWAGAPKFGRGLYVFTLEGVEPRSVTQPTTSPSAVPRPPHRRFSLAADLLVSIALVLAGIWCSWAIGWGAVVGVPLVVLGVLRLSFQMLVLGNVLTLFPCANCGGKAFRWRGNPAVCLRCGELTNGGAK